MAKNGQADCVLPEQIWNNIN